MKPDEIAGTLSVLASALSDLNGQFSFYARGEEDVLAAPSLLWHIDKCIRTVTEIRHALKAECDKPSDENGETPIDIPTAMRFKHLVDDLDEFLERVHHVRFGLDFFASADRDDSRAFVGGREALVGAIAFACTDLRVFVRRISGLASFYAFPFAPIVVQDSDDMVASALSYFDAERYGDVLHMEGSSERRPRVAPPPTKPSVLCTLVPVMYGTDRPKRLDCATTLVDYGNRPVGESLTFGTAEVSIPRGTRHRIGRLERPTLWKFQFREDPERHITIVTCEERGLDSWTAVAEARLEAAGERTALVFIHGFNVSFDDAIRRAAQIGWDLQFKGIIAAFTWCSEHHHIPSLTAYMTDERNARLAAARLLEFLAVLRDKVLVNAIHVVAHSMGNIVLIEALRASLAAGGAKSTCLNEVVMAAPDYDAVLFKRVIRELNGAAKRYTLYGSASDRALAASKALRDDYPRAGDGGDNVLVVEGVDTIDATSVGTDVLGLNHSYFSAERTVLTDIYYLVNESLPAARRGGMLAATVGGLPYWRFAP
jgi:esterase/lipase superfamily enzyme